jgi:hypothetical protein
MATKFEDFILADSADDAVVVGLDENGLNARFPTTIFTGEVPPDALFAGGLYPVDVTQTIPVSTWTGVVWENIPGNTTSLVLQEDKVRWLSPAGLQRASGIFQVVCSVAWENTNPALIDVHRRRIRIMQEVDGVVSEAPWGHQDELFFPDAGNNAQISYAQVIVNQMSPYAEQLEHDAYIWFEVWHNAEVAIGLKPYIFDAPLLMIARLSELQSRSIIPPTPALEAAAELVYLSTTAFNGLTATFNMVNADPTGDYVLFNYKGYGRLTFSGDAGATWAEITNNMGSGTSNSTNWKQLDFRWSVANDEFQALTRRIDTIANYWSTLDPLSPTWSSATSEGSYNRAMHIDASGNVFYGLRIGSTGSTEISIRRNIPYDATLTFTTGTRIDKQAISLLGADTGTLFYGYADETGINPYYVRTAPTDFSSQGTDFGAVFANNYKVASRGQGIVLGYRSTSGSVVTLDKLDIASGVIQITIDFGVNLSFADICYSPELDGYMVIAIDADDNRLAHIRYTEGDNTAIWLEVDPVYLNGYVESDNYRQIVHSVGDVYYYAYLQKYGALNVATLEKITLNEAPTPPNVVETVFIQNYETYLAGVYTTTVGDNLDAPSLPQSATAKYGTWAMGYTGANRGQIVAGVEIDPNNFTLELYYNAQSLASNAGLFFYGTSGQDAIRVQGTVGTTGAMDFFFGTGGVSNYVATAAGVITVGSYAEICFEADRAAKMMRIYVNGNVVASVAMTRSVWNGSQDFYLAYARGGTTNRYSLGYIDSTRLSRGARYGGTNYTPHTGPFTS